MGLAGLLRGEQLVLGGRGLMPVRSLGLERRLGGGTRLAGRRGGRRAELRREPEHREPLAKREQRKLCRRRLVYSC